MLPNSDLIVKFIFNDLKTITGNTEKATTDRNRSPPYV